MSGQPANKLDPVLVRRVVKQITNIDPGANPQFTDINSIIAGTGVIPVIPMNTPANEALQVYPRGWWGGGTVDAIGNAGTAQSQSLVNATWSGAADGSTVYTVTTGKTFYCAGVAMGANAAGTTLNVLKVAGTSVVSSLTNQTSFATALTSGGQTPIFKAASASAITANSGGAGNFGTLWGWEE